MRGTLRIILEVLLYAVLYALIALFCNLILGLFLTSTTSLLLFSQLSAAVITVVLFTATRWSVIGVRTFSPPHVKFWLFLLLLSCALIILSEFLEERFALALPAEYEESVRALINHRLGYLTVAIFAPIAEEVVLRGAILRCLLALKCNMWIPIVLSALLFGGLHGNLAQGCHGIIMGLLLGWLYARTGSLLPSLFVHWLNNTIAFLSVRLLPADTDLTSRDLCGGNSLLLYALLVCSAIVVVVALWQINKHLETFKRNK